MAQNVGPLISLAVSSTTRKSHTSFGPAALNLAANFNRELSLSKSDADRAKICRTYRDTIMRVSMWADDIAAAFTDAFAPFLQKSQQGQDAEVWKSFASLAQRSQHSRAHDAQRIRHQTAIVAIWGAEIFEHYGWHELSLDNTRLLRSVACTQHDWKLAVNMINDVMLERHEIRVVEHDNRLPLIGEHPHGSKIQDCRSPVQRRDIMAVIQRLQENNDEVDQEEQRSGRAFTIAGTPIRDYGLETDKHGMVVPREGPGVIRDTSSPSDRVRKRRKLGHLAVEDLRVTRNPSAALASPQISSTAASTPVSELTQFEEESFNHTISDGRDSHLRTSSIAADRASDANLVESVTPSKPPTEDTSEDESRGTSRGPSCHRTCQSISTLRRASTDHSILVPGDTESHRDLAAGSFHGLTGSGVEEVEEDDEGFVADTMLTRSASAETMHEQTGHKRSSTMIGVNCQGPHNAVERSEKCLPRSSPEYKLLPSDTTETVLDLLSPSSERSAGNICEEWRPAGSTPDSIANQGRDRGTEEDSQMEDESDTEFCNSGDIAALEEAARIGSSIKLSTDAEAPSDPTSCGSFTPHSRETLVHQYCTHANANDDNAIVSHMASSYSSRLRNLLDLAQENGKNRETEEHNRLKVAWLERTRWANIYEDPEGVDPTSPLPLDADVWYMAWETFQQRAHAGEIFGKPIVIKQKFQDSDMYEPHGYLSILEEKFVAQQVDVQNSETGGCRKMNVKDFCAIRAGNKKVDDQMLAATSNAVNLRKIANADAPLLTRMSRFRLLETLTERAKNIGPGKRISSQAVDVSECIGFDLLGFEGAFTGPHMDALVGTWVRCLSGEKAWIFAPGMDAKDWDDFARNGPSWCPSDKGRVIVLEKDDVLLMPPGLRTVHTVFTLSPSVMEGGMLWDELNIPALLDALLWVAQNQSCTNEVIAYQLPSVIDSLELWLEEHGDRLTASGNISNHTGTIEQGIDKLRELGCKCISGCTKNPDCLCNIYERRCTAWCAKHPTLPEQAKGRAHRCMYSP